MANQSVFFLDTEFNDEIGDCRIDPISVALTCEDASAAYYAVSNQFSETGAHPWLREHVLPKLPPVKDRVALIEIREGITKYFAQFKPQAGTKARIWGKNVGADMVVVGLIFGGLSQFYATMVKIGYSRTFFQDTDMLRGQLNDRNIIVPRIERPAHEHHVAIHDAEHERREYMAFKALL